MQRENPRELGAAVREILKRSVVDPDFRQLAAKDAAAALRKVNPTLTTSTRLKFIDNFGKDHKTVALPDPVSGLDGLSDEDIGPIL